MFKKLKGDNMFITNRTIDRLFDDVMKMNDRNVWNLLYDNMKVENDELIMQFDVPGFSKKDFKIKVEDYVLTIEGETDTRTFNKQYKLNKDWDTSKVSAKVENGVLTITTPKLEEKKSKVVEVVVK